MKTRRGKGICIVVAAMLLCPLLFGLFVIAHTVHFHVNQYDAAFWQCREEFVLVKDYLWERFPDRLTEEYQRADVYPWLWVSHDENGSRCLQDPNAKNALQLPGEVTQALDRICSTDVFPAYLDLIRFEEGQIHFCGNTERGWYALIYSPKGRPKTFGGNEPEEVCIKRIGGGWYHATRLEDWMVLSKW